MTDKVMAEFMRLGLDENMQSPEALLTEHEAGIRAAARVKYGAPDTDSNGIPVTSFSKPQPPAQPAELTPQQAAAKMEELKSDPMFVKRYVAGDAQAGREMLALMQKISPRRK